MTVSAYGNIPENKQNENEQAVKEPVQEEKMGILGWMNPEDYSFDCMLRMERFQIRYILGNPDEAGKKALAMALKANPKVAVLPCACDNLSSGAAKVCTTSVEALRGWADNAYALGAEGLYFFNAAYMPDSAQREIYDAGFDPQTVAASARRHVVTYHDCVPRGMPNGCQLPIPLDKGGEVRVRVGSVPDGRDVVNVIVAGKEMALAQGGVRLNGASPLKTAPLSGDLSMYGHAENAWKVVFPASAIKAGVNVVGFEESSGAGNATWLEIDVAKPERRLCKAIGGDEE